jgi:hypothetical protein
VKFKTASGKIGWAGSAGLHRLASNPRLHVAIKKIFDRSFTVSVDETDSSGANHVWHEGKV